jgi:hypothetical protein
VLIGTLTRFFSFAAHFDPEIQSINKTTHTSSYTYWFLVLSAEILTKCSLSEETQARHAYLLAVIAARLDEDKACDYLVLTALIYASIISRSSAMYLSPFGGNFLRAVTRHRDRFKGNLSEKQSQLYRAVKANEVAMGQHRSCTRSSQSPRYRICAQLRRSKRHSGTSFFCLRQGSHTG